MDSISDIIKIRQENIDTFIKHIKSFELLPNIRLTEISEGYNKVSVILDYDNYMNMLGRYDYASREELYFFINRNTNEIDRCEILSLDTIDFYRRKHLASFLVTQAKIICEEFGICTIFGTYMDDISMKFYIANGFNINSDSRTFNMNLEKTRRKK